MPEHPQPSLFFVTPGFGRSAVGGLGAAAERIAGHFATAHAVTIVTPSTDLPPHTYARDPDDPRRVRVGRGGESKLFLQFLTDVLEELSRDAANPRFLGFYCSELAYAATLAAGRRGSAPLLFARGNDIDLELFGEWAFHIHYALQRAERVFCVSRELEQKVRAFCPAARTRYIPNGVDERLFPFQGDYTPNPRPVVGLFGDVKQKKGLETLLLAGLEAGHCELRIVGQLREDSRKLLHGFLTLHPEFRERLTTLPYTADPALLRRHYEGVDLVCIPSVHEGMSNVMLEALALGKICVASAVGGARDVIRDGENGLLFEPRSAESLAAALVRAADCLRDGPEAVRQRARDTIRDGYTARRERKRYLRALRAICS
jgi:glycosyltransferase involved in cell wall biosynthesis